MTQRGPTGPLVDGPSPSMDLGGRLRSVARGLRRSPGWSVPAVGLPALALGVVGASWAALDQVVLRPLPVHEQDRLVVAWTDHPVRGFDHFPVVPELFEAAEAGGIPALAQVAAVGSYGAGQRAVEGPDGPEPVAWAQVLGDFFVVLGVDAALGRTLRLDDDVPGAADYAAVISHGLWQRRFGGDPDVLGRTLTTRAATYTVVGVLPREFDHPRGAEVWTPTRPGYPDWAAERPRLELDLVGRLAPGAGPEAVAAQLQALSRSTPALDRLYEGTVPVVRPFTDVVLGDLAPTLRILFLGGILVLGVAALALATMALVRGAGRARETAVRRALGAAPGRLQGDAILEGLLLAAMATGLGTLLARGALAVLVPLAPPGLPRLDLLRGPGAAGVGVMALAAVLAVGGAVVLPRWLSDPRASLAGLRDGRGSTSGPGAHRFRDGVVAGQVALAVWVLATGGLLVRTVANLQALDPGFDPDDLVVVAMDHPVGGPLGEVEDARALERVTARLEAFPGIRAATPVQMAPLPGNGAWQTLLYKAGQTPEEAARENAYLFMEFVEPDFTEVLDVPVLEGRGLTPADDEEAGGVIVVNQAAARAYWPGDDAVGQQVTTGLPGAEGELLTVVGVVADTRYGALREIEPAVYFPLRQTGAFQSRYLLIRTTGSAAPVFRLAREALAAEGSAYRALSASTVRDRLAEPLVRPRFAASLLSLLALTALIIAVAGVYGTMAFRVRSGRRELGVRMACGGSPRDVAGRVIRRGVAIAGVGGLVGVAGASLTGGLFRSLLVEVEPTDPWVLTAAVALALGCAALACSIPARQAAGLDPAEVLRAD